MTSTARAMSVRWNIVGASAMTDETCMLCDHEPCKCAEIYCGHIVRRGECVICDPRPHAVMECVKCKPGQTWHFIDGNTATCRKCETVRPIDMSEGDIGIWNR